MREIIARLEWGEGEKAFSLGRVCRSGDDWARGLFPSGMRLEMSKDDWLQLASAINRLFPGDHAPPKRDPVRSRRRDPGVNTGKPWTRELDLDLSSRWGEGSEIWKHGPACKELAKHFGRSSGGIMSRLMKLGLLDPKTGAVANAPASPPADE